MSDIAPEFPADVPPPAAPAAIAPADEAPVVETSTAEDPAAQVPTDDRATADDLVADTVAAPAPTADAAAPEERGPGPAAVAKLLAERFPVLFAPGQAKPLKLRIQADIQARLAEPVSRKVLSIVLQRHTTSTAYLRAMSTATQRFDLDGQPAGELAEEHRSAATAEVERRRAIVAEKRAAERNAQREAQREQIKAQRQEQRAQQREQRAAQVAAHAQREAEGADRAARANLLRAFETTTLTRANFCALKGIAEADLDAQLALAREERTQRLAALPRHEPTAERPPMPPRAERGAPPRAERGAAPADRGAAPPRGPRPPRREGRPPRG